MGRQHHASSHQGSSPSQVIFPAARWMGLDGTNSYSQPRRKTSIQLGLIPVWRLYSGKADGVSSQRTSGSLFRITGTVSRQSGPLMPRSSLDLENPLPAHSGKKTPRRWALTKPTVLHPCVEPTWCSPKHVVHESRTCQHRSFIKTNSGISGEQQLNGCRDVCIHFGRYFHRSSVKTNKDMGRAVNNNTTAKPHWDLYIKATAHVLHERQARRVFFGICIMPNIESAEYLA